MATTETDRAFKSSYSRNMDQQSTRTPGASRGVRRVFEDNGGETRSTTTRYNRERNESPSSTTRNTTVTDRFNKMTIDDIEKDDKGREEVTEEEMPSARSRLKKDPGARGRGDDNDGENNEDKGDDEDAPKKSLKKASATTGAGKRRKEKKNLREKRRSTGVVIMPGQAADPSDEQAQTVAKNTAANMGEPADGATASSADVLNYQETITQLQDELAAKVKELDSLRNAMDNLRNQNTRLKDENSALLRVVGSLSGTGGR